MPYILAGLAALFGLVFLFRLIRSGARRGDGGISPLYVTGLVAGLGVAGLLAMMGRLPAALFILILVAGFSWVDRLARKIRPRPEPGPVSEGTMSRAEALEILGLSEGASDMEIQEAYKRLMSRVHPDLEGSGWLAAKLNQARDVLQGSHGSSHANDL